MAGTRGEGGERGQGLMRAREQILAVLHQACVPSESASGTSSEDQTKGTLRGCCDGCQRVMCRR